MLFDMLKSWNYSKWTTFLTYFYLINWPFLGKNLITYFFYTCAVMYFLKNTVRFNNTWLYVFEKMNVHSFKVIKVELLYSYRCNWDISSLRALFFFFKFYTKWWKLRFLYFYQWILLINTIFFSLQSDSELIYIVLLKILVDKLHLSFALIFTHLLLLFNYKSVSVFKCIFCTSLEVFWNLRPFLLSFIVFDEF